MCAEMENGGNAEMEPGNEKPVADPGGVDGVASHPP